MKKLSLLVALVLLITVGGVYATWNYAQGDVTLKQGFVLPKMEEVITSGSKGTIEVDTSGLTMKVDDIDDGEVHNPKLVISGEIVVTFVPAEGADEIVDQNGIKMQAVISCTENWTYNDGQSDKQIITVDTANNANVFATGTATKRFVITADQLSQIINIADLTLPTHNDFLNFQTILNRGNIKISVSEVK